MEEERSGEMTRFKAEISHAEQVCRECGEKYQANHILIYKAPRDLSGGLCLECRLKQREALDAQQRELLEAGYDQLRMKWRLASGIPHKFQTGGDFASFNPGWTKQDNNFGQLLEKCREYAEGFPLDYLAFLATGQGAYKSMMLLSPKTQGVGKTHIASAICHRILDRWHGETGSCPVAFTSEAALYSSIQSTYSYTTEEKRALPSEQDIIARLIRVNLLILDDVGTEERYSKDFTNRILFALINGRYENDRPIVITSNLDKDQLNKYVSDKEGRVRIFDRLREMCAGSFFQVKGPSHR